MSTALYRKYRPDNFENIIGQSQVTDVLKNQIKELEHQTQVVRRQRNAYMVLAGMLGVYAVVK